MHPLARLSKYFAISCAEEICKYFTRAEIEQWAEEIKSPKYQLTWKQHQFLIGRLG